MSSPLKAFSSTLSDSVFLTVNSTSLIKPETDYCRTYNLLTHMAFTLNSVAKHCNGNPRLVLDEVHFPSPICHSSRWKTSANFYIMEHNFKNCLCSNRCNRGKVQSPGAKPISFISVYPQLCLCYLSFQFTGHTIFQPLMLTPFSCSTPPQNSPPSLPPLPPSLPPFISPSFLHFFLRG